MTLEANWNTQYTTFKDRHTQFWGNFIQDNFDNYKLLNRNKSNCLAALNSLSIQHSSIFSETLIPYCRYLRDTGELSENRALLLKAREINKKNQVAPFSASVDYNVAEIYALTGEYELAKVHFEAALEASESLNLPYLKLSALSGLGRLSKVISGEEQAITYLERAVSIGLGLENHPELFRAGCYLAQQLVFNGESVRAEQLVQDLLERVSLNQPTWELGILYFTMGSLKCNTGKVQEGTNYLFKALEVEIKISNTSMQINCYSNIAKSCAYLLEFQNAIKYRELALKLAKQIGRVDTLSEHYNHYAILLKNMHRYEEGFEKIELALKVANQLNQPIEYISVVKGALLIDLKRYSAAEELLNNGYPAVQAGNNKHLKILYSLQYGILATRQCNYQVAESYFQTALNLAKSSKLNVYRHSILHAWAECEVDLGDLQKAKHFFEQTIHAGNQFGSIDHVAVGKFKLAKIAFSEGEHVLAKKYLNDSINLLKGKLDVPVLANAIDWGRENNLID